MIQDIKTTPTLLQIKNLKTYFYTITGVAKSVDDVSIIIKKGEILGIVGESGSGKSVTALSIMRLIQSPPGKIVSGEILLDGKNILNLSEPAMRDIRGNRISMIFQEPMTSLNPLFTIGNQISEMFIRHKNMDKEEALQQSIAMLEKVQIPSPAKRIMEYPHQMSGGMRQRVMIAMALSCHPELLIADEPTTALDVTIQAQMIDLMLHLKDSYDSSVMMITHDLGVIAEIAQRVVVMYAGQVIEEGTVFDIFEDPLHPYTKALLRSIPKLGNKTKFGRQKLYEIKGIVPSLYDLPAGCHFFPRCSVAISECEQRAVPLKNLENDRKVRCILYNNNQIGD